MIYFLGLIIALLLFIFILFLIGSLISMSLVFLINFRLNWKKLILPSFLILTTIILYLLNSYFVVSLISKQGVTTTLMRIVFNNLSFDIILYDILFPLGITWAFTMLVHSFCIYSYNINYTKIKDCIIQLFKKLKKQDDLEALPASNNNIINTTNTNATGFEYKLKIEENENIDIIDTEKDEIISNYTETNLAIIKDRKISYIRCLIASIILTAMIVIYVSIFFGIGMVIPNYFNLPFLK